MKTITLTKQIEYEILTEEEAYERLKEKSKKPEDKLIGMMEGYTRIKEIINWLYENDFIIGETK